MKIILGSGSKWRKIILKNAGYEFDVIIPNIDEKKIRSVDYEKLPLLIARAKAEALLPKITGPAILITSDQVVVCDNELWEKPNNEEEARKFMNAYSSGKAGQTNTSIVIINTENGKRAEGVDIARVYWKPIPENVIEKYIKEKDTFLCAGGFTIDHRLIAPYIDKIEGDRDSIEGLPMRLMEKLLNEVR